MAFVWLGSVLSCEWVAFGLIALPSEQVQSLPLWLLFLLAVMALLFTGALIRHRRVALLGKLGFLSLAGLLVALALGANFWLTIFEDRQDGSLGTLTTEMQVLDDPHESAYSAYSLVSASLEDGRRIKARLFWPAEQTPLPKGSKLVVQAPSFIPVDTDQRWLFEQGICGSIRTNAVEDAGFEPTLLGAIDRFRAANVERIQAMDTTGAALLCGVLLGDRTALADSALEQDFISCGLTHLIAVSGSHLAVIATICGWILSRLPLGKRPGVALLLLVLATYVFLTGLAPSAIRSAVMAAVAGLSFAVGRREHAPAALAASALIMMLVYPPHAFSVGFWLSVSAVLGITLFSSLFHDWLISFTIGRPPALMHVSQMSMMPGISAALFGGIAPTGPDNTRDSSVVRDSGSHVRFPNRGDDKVLSCSEQERLRSWQSRLKLFNRPLSALATTLAATVATLPIAVPVFAVLSLISPLANLLVAPLVAVMLALGMLALCLGPIAYWPSGIALTLAGWLGDACAQVAAWMAALPYASVPLALDIKLSIPIAIIILTVVYRLWPRPRRCVTRIACAGMVAVALAMTFVSLPLTQAQLVVMDIGQGDSILIREGNDAILIDTGASPSALVHALARNQVTHLDAVLITHLDTDHAAALGRLRGLVQVDAVYFAAGLLANQAEDTAIRDATDLVGSDKLRELTAGDHLSVGNHLELTSVWPAQQAQSGSNEESLCVVLTYDADNDQHPEHQALLTGDVESPQLEQILAVYPRLQADILKVGHHGSKDAITAEQLRLLNTKYSLISVGADNRYGHPASDTLDILEQSGCVVARTDLYGDITLTFSAPDLGLRYTTGTQYDYY
jgi:competence protein ComEC